MPSSPIELKEFFTPGKTLDKAHVILHIAEPNAAHERERGYLFALVELSEGTIELIETFQKIISLVEERYYDRNEKTEYLLERILQSVNREYQDIFSDNDTDIHCVMGTVRGETIMMSYHGNPTAVVYYKNDQQLQCTPVITEPSESSTVFFSEMISGTLNNGDFLYTATPHVNDYFPLDRIGKLLGDRTIKECGAHIQKVLTEMASDYSFGGVFFHVLRKNETPRLTTSDVPIKPGSEASLNKLLQSAEATASTLSPPILGNVKKTWQELKDKTSAKESSSNRDFNYRTRRDRTINQDDPSTPNDWLIIFGKTLFLIGRGFAVTVARIGIGIARCVIGIYYFVTNRHRRMEQIRQVQEWFHVSRRKLIGLPIMSKIILASLLLTTVIFVGSLGYLHWSRRAQAEKQTIQNIIQGIRDKKDAAEASLMYEDKTKAQTLLTEADNLIDQLPSVTKEHQATREAMVKELLALRDKIRNEKRIEPELIADLGLVNPQAKTTRLTMFGDTMIAFGPNDDSWYLINTITKHIDGQRHDALKNLTEASATNEEDLIVFRSTNNEVANFDTKTGSFTKKTISFPADNAQVTAFDFYNRKLYSVDSANRKIYRHNQTQTGYDKGTPWNTSGDSRLGGVAGLTIDGDLYILKENGEVRKWFRGEEQGFLLASVDPILDQASEITTSAETPELFIIDRTKKRVVIFDKNGGFIEQITSNVWKAPTSISIQDKGKTLFVLDDNKVYKVSR